MTTVLLPPGPTAQTLNERAYQAMQAGNWPAAYHLLESARPYVSPAQEPQLYNNLGQCALLASQLAAAEEYLRRSLEYPQPPQQRAAILTNLSIVDRLCMRTSDSMVHIQEAVRLDPKMTVAQLNRVINADLDPATGPAAQLAYRQQYATTIPHVRSRRFPGRSRDPGRPLRVGYLGGNFAEHSAAYAYCPIIRGHTDAVAPYCYSTWQQDQKTEQFQQPHVMWRDCRGQPAKVILEQILTDQIDILVDLAGHTAGGMLEVFALRAAPIQVTAWGYALTTGLAEMDVLFTERTFCPPAFPWISERQRVYLPALIAQEPPEGPPPLKDRTPGPLRFGYGGSPAKLNPIILRRWGALLRAVPEATLECQYLGFEQPAVQAMIVSELEIDPSRVTFGPMMTHHEHLDHVAEWDVALDSWPHTGGVTTLDAAMCGVPTLTLCDPAEVLASRTSSSLMLSMGMHRWVTYSVSEWLREGVAAAEWWAAGGMDKARVRAAFENSCIRDIPAYVSAVEDAYRALFKDWATRKGR